MRIAKPKYIDIALVLVTSIFEFDIIAEDGEERAAEEIHRLRTHSMKHYHETLPGSIGESGE